MGVIFGLTKKSSVTAADKWVNGKDPDFFSSGLMALEHRWSKCITLEDDYIEKEEVDLNRNLISWAGYLLTRPRSTCN